MGGQVGRDKVAEGVVAGPSKSGSWSIEMGVAAELDRAIPCIHIQLSGSASPRRASSRIRQASAIEASEICGSTTEKWSTPLNIIPNPSML